MRALTLALPFYAATLLTACSGSAGDDSSPPNHSPRAATGADAGETGGPEPGNGTTPTGPQSHVGTSAGGTAGSGGAATQGPETPASASPKGGVEATDVAAGFFHTQGSAILDAHNNPVRLTGLSWFGMETSIFTPHGLWSRSLDSMLDQIKSLGFNMMRIPFTNEMLKPGSMPTSIDFNQNPDLQGLTPLALLDKLVAKAKARGLRIVLDRHRPESGGQSPLWYTSQTSEQQWISDWTMLARHFKGNSTVVGVDLHNEPHGAASWGDGVQATDWRLAAERAGAAIQNVNPDVLIIVEGVEVYQDIHGWWGGNLAGVQDAPVRLPIAGRLVYSPHEYPASVNDQPWFHDPIFPNNMTSVWDARFGYIAKRNLAPLWIGEFGSKFQTPQDHLWMTGLVSYIRDVNLSFAYWSWNPDSGDTGGILQDDWKSVNTDKHTAIQGALAPMIP